MEETFSVLVNDLRFCLPHLCQVVAFYTLPGRSCHCEDISLKLARSEQQRHTRLFANDVHDSVGALCLFSSRSEINPSVPENIRLEHLTSRNV